LLITFYHWLVYLVRDAGADMAHRWPLTR